MSNYLKLHIKSPDSSSKVDEVELLVEGTNQTLQKGSLVNIQLGNDNEYLRVNYPSDSVIATDPKLEANAPVKWRKMPVEFVTGYPDMTRVEEQILENYWTRKIWQSDGVYYSLFLYEDPAAEEISSTTYQKLYTTCSLQNIVISTRIREQPYQFCPLMVADYNTNFKIGIAQAVDELKWAVVCHSTTYATDPLADTNHAIVPDVPLAASST